MASKVQQLKLLRAELEMMNAELKESAKLSSDFLKGSKIKASTKSLSDAANAVTKLRKSNDELIDNQKEQTKVQQQLTQATDEEVKAKLRYQKANKEQRDTLKQLIVLQDEELGTLEKLEAQNNLLRIERKKLNLETQEGVNRLREINAQIDANNQKIVESSDQLKKQRLNVGNYKSALDGLGKSFDDQQEKLKILRNLYKEEVTLNGKRTKAAKELRKELRKQVKEIEDVEDATKKAEKANKKLGDTAKAIGIGALIALLAKLGGLFSQNREATIEAEKQLAIFTETLKTLFSALVNSLGGIKMIFLSLWESAQSFYINFEKGWVELLISIEEGKSLFSDTEEEIESLNKRLSGLNKEQENLANSTNTLAGGWNAITDAFDGFWSTTGQAIDFQEKYLELQLNTRIEIEKQTRALGGLQEKRQILQDISDDDTLGFLTRAEAVEKAQKAAEDFANKEIQLARIKEKLTIQEIKGQLLRAKVFTETELDAIKTGDQLNRILRSRAVAIKITDDAEAAFTAAYVERKDKEIEAESFARDQQEKNRKTFRDDYEQRLDIIESLQSCSLPKTRS